MITPAETRIRQLVAEIERLNIKADRWITAAGECAATCDVKDMEIERLTEESERRLKCMERRGVEIERLRSALESIAKNTCCDRCQEAALVARVALKGEAA